MITKNDPSDMRHETIQKLFYKQIQDITRRSSIDQKMQSFDMQFSDMWI